MSAQPNIAPLRTKVDAAFGTVTTELNAVSTAVGQSYAGPTRTAPPAAQGLMLNANEAPEKGDLLLEVSPPGLNAWTSRRPNMVRASGGIAYIVPAGHGTGFNLHGFDWRVLWVAKQASASLTVTSQPFTA